MIMRQNNIRASRGERKLLGEDANVGKEEKRRTNFLIVVRDETTEVAEHELNFMRK